MTHRVRTLLVDDEPLANQYLARLLAAHPEILIVGVATSVTEAREQLASLRPLLVFLDVEMGGASGFALFDSLAGDTQFIMVTAHAKYALQAFDVDATDYLLKPVRGERLAEALRRAGAIGGVAAALSIEDSVVLRDGARLVAIALRDIGYVASEDDYSRVHSRGRKSLLVHKRMREWETLLPPDAFARLDRSLFVQVAKIAAVETRSRNEGLLHWRDGSEAIVVGRTALAAARTLMLNR
jgi:two-component system, LytTR family, response regulator